MGGSKNKNGHLSFFDKCPSRLCNSYESSAGQICGRV